PLTGLRRVAALQSRPSPAALGRRGGTTPSAQKRGPALRAAGRFAISNSRRPEWRRRRGGRAVEGARLESVYGGNSIAGSNPAPSAIPPCLAVSDCPDRKPKAQKHLPFPSFTVSLGIVLSQHRWGNEVGNGYFLSPFRSW